MSFFLNETFKYMRINLHIIILKWMHFKKVFRRDYHGTLFKAEKEA